MKLSNLIDPHLVLLDANVDTLDGAIEAGLKAITALYPQEVKYDEVMQRLDERRRLGGTCFPSGISIPHARLQAFNDFIIAAIVPKKPIVSDEKCIDASCADAPPIRIVWLILLSQTSSTIYLNTLAKLIEASKDEAIMASLTKAESPAQFVSVIDDAGYVVKKNLVVTDIMNRDVVSVKETATLKEVLDVIYQKKLHYVPIVNDAGALVGELGVLDLLKAGIPDYAFRIGSLKFLAELEPMTELLQNEDKILVGSIMQKPVPIGPATSVIEVAFEMATGQEAPFRRRRGRSPHRRGVVHGHRVQGLASLTEAI